MTSSVVWTFMSTDFCWIEKMNGGHECPPYEGIL
jgi:hypothetical protein